MSLLPYSGWGIPIIRRLPPIGTSVLLAHPYTGAFGLTSQHHPHGVLATVALPAVLPDLYNYFPLIVRNLDIEMVDRPSIPLYWWDSIPSWDTTLYTWDEVLGPEPILKTTTRVIQLELERTAQEIRNLSLLYSPNVCDRVYLPYLGDMLGTPCPSVSEEGQRNFINNLVATYRHKGTPLSFYKLFRFLGFEPLILEQYQRKSDAELVQGPQKALVATSYVQREPVSTTIASAGPYTINLLHNTIVRGSIRIYVYDKSTNKPTVISDDANGGWSNGLVGSVDYVTGMATLTLAAVPSLIGEPIKADYNYQTDIFPDPIGDRYQDRFRSSYVSATLTMIDPALALTSEMNTRLLTYVSLMKPAHVIIDFIGIRFEFEDHEDINEDDDLNPFAVLHMESLFGCLYRGYGWHVTDNASLSVDPALVGAKARDYGEFIKTYYTGAVGDAAAYDAWDRAPPYVYPLLRNGLIYQPNAADNWEAMWGSVGPNPAAPAPLEVFGSVVTNDIPAPTTTNFSIDIGVGTSLTVDDKVCFTSGALAGEQSTITVFTPAVGYYDVTVSPALPLAPTISDALTIVDDASANRTTLTDRPQDPMALWFIETIYGPGTLSAPDGFLKVFAGNLATKVPMYTLGPGNTVTLTFDVGAGPVTETDDGAGGFTNVSGNLLSASINYTTGAFNISFTVPSPAPIAASSITLTYASVVSQALGAY